MLMMNPELDKRTAQFLLEEFLSLDTREGFRAELIDGEIVVTPPPYGTHGEIIGLIAEQIFAKSAVRMNFSPDKGLIVPDRGIADLGHVIPDATFAPAALRLFHGAAPWMEAQGVAMVVEVTSSDKIRDREAKRLSYAAASIPLYLLVDREFQQVTLFSEPMHGDYASTLIKQFGSALKLPEPFSCELDTTDFRD
jgi:Uma2 family endonuclease